MSGHLLEGFGMAGEPGEDYTPGDDAHLALADEVITRYIEAHEPGSALDRELNRRHSYGDTYSRPGIRRHLARSEALKDIISGILPQDADAQLFLDTAVQRCFLRAGSVRWDRPAEFINPLVQALYDCGHNGLSLDVSGLTIERAELARNLTGAEERLRLSLRFGIAEDLAADTRDCDLTLRGDIVTLAYEARDSVFRCDGLVMEAGTLAEGCEFHIRSARAVEARPSSLDRYRRMKKCSFYVSSGVSDAELLWLDGESFFHEGNRLYVPEEGAPGEWAEVTP